MMQFEGRSPRNSSRWLLQTLALLIALQQWQGDSWKGVVGLATAVTSVKPPGEMIPQQVEISIGSSTALRCTVSEANSLKIWFYESRNNSSIKQPSDKIQVENEYTATLIITNATEQKSRYQCMVGSKAIGATDLFVGTEPQNVTDFSCLVYDYQYMQCNFTKPRNMLFTTFQLEYRIAGDKSNHSCNLQEYESDKLQCNVNASDYYPVRDQYVFTLVGTNKLGSNYQHFAINNHKIVIPSAVDVHVVDTSSEKVTLQWSKAKKGYYRTGLRYDIQIKDGDAEWHTPTHSEETCDNEICRVILTNLIAFWPYMVRVRAKSMSVDEGEERLWSNATVKSFRTNSTLPRRAPDIPLGSFYIDSTETQLHLYWSPLDETEHYGPLFEYVVDEVDEDGVVIQSNRTTLTSLSLPWRNSAMQLFRLRAANEHGESRESSLIRVYRSGSTQNELNEKNIAKVYHNGSYTLSWTPPINLVDLMNYTVFWCIPKIELPNQCKGPISYAYLDKLVTNFTTDPRDRSLNLAISANYPNYNKGMQWARCSADISSELMKTELEVSVLNESAVLVKWTSGSVCPTILEGYNLTYCPEYNKMQCNHHGKVLLLPRDFRNYTITSLPPYKGICVSMFMYSSKKRGRESDLICVTTKQSAPTSPLDLQLEKADLTSKSAKVSWKPPNIFNGVLRNYTIYWRKTTSAIYEYKGTVNSSQTSFTLTSLNSYSEYEVFVTATTVAESPPSNHLLITTLIGIPSSPKHVNIFENDTVISWSKPDLPSGSQLFYMVALLRRYNDNESVYELISIVKGESCRFQLPSCENQQTTFVLEVRAVNEAQRFETDKEIPPMVWNTLLETAHIDQSFCQSENGKQDLHDLTQRDDKQFFASPWIQAQRDYVCPTGSNTSIYAVAFLISIVFAMYTCYWVRTKYYKMKNIKVILPEGLVDPMTNYKYDSNGIGPSCNLKTGAKKEFTSDISRSNDCLVAFEHKDSQKLISSLQTRTSNAPSSISISSHSSSKEQHNDDQAIEQPSLETTNEELSSNSSSCSDSNFAYSSNHLRPERLTSVDSTNTLHIYGSDREEELEEKMKEEKSRFHKLEEPNAALIGEESNYVTFNTQLLTSEPGSNSQRPTQFLPFSPMTNDGYIQPSAVKQMFHPQTQRQIPRTASTPHSENSPAETQKSAEESVQKPFTTPLPNTLLGDGLDFLQDSSSTSPIAPHLLEPDRSTDISTLITTAICVDSQQPLTNNNSIYGYVTPQLLADFGTNVAHAKEVTP